MDKEEKIEDKKKDKEAMKNKTMQTQVAALTMGMETQNKQNLLRTRTWAPTHPVNPFQGTNRKENRKEKPTNKQTTDQGTN